LWWIDLFGWWFGNHLVDISALAVSRTVCL